MERPFCQLSGAWNFEVAVRFVENLCTPWLLKFLKYKISLLLKGPVLHTQVLHVNL